MAGGIAALGSGGDNEVKRLDELFLGDGHDGKGPYQATVACLGSFPPLEQDPLTPITQVRPVSASSPYFPPSGLTLLS